MSHDVRFPEGWKAGSEFKQWFWISYQKDSYKEDFPEMVPFYMVTHGLEGIRVTLAIDLDGVKFDARGQSNYIFRCSEFFRFMNTKSNSRKIVFINEKTITSKGRIINFAENGVTSLRIKGASDPASRKYLPLIEISQSVFDSIFDNRINNDEHPGEELLYIQDAIRKVSDEVKYKIQSSSLFEEWFIKSYFYYLLEQYKSIDFASLRDVLHIYCSNIYELVQNIIYHTAEKTGLMYFVFNSYADLSEEQKSSLPMPSGPVDDPNCRFITIGIADFNHEGISESFHRKYFKEKLLDIEEFFSPKLLSTNEVTHLDFRRMAHLGLPVLMSTISNYRGCFRVESNFHEVKRAIELKNGELEKLPERYYVDGTHYDILLPIVPGKEIQSTEWSLMQKSSILSRLVHLKKNKFASIPRIKLSQYFSEEFQGQDKGEQVSKIESVGKAIASAYGNSHELAIDYDVNYVQPSTVVKLVSYLQMMGGGYHPVIVLTSLSDDMVDLICGLIMTVLVRPGVRPIWSSESAVVLLSKGLRYQIISGSTPEELYSINADYQNYYYSQKNYFEKELTVFGKLPPANNLDKFILPYELLIGDARERYSLFFSYVHNLLKQPMGTNKMGYRLNPYTYIGNKLIVKSFYEADSLFQNSFFTDRFAYIIADKISNSVKGVSDLVIIGYKYYSEQLVKTVARYLKDAHTTKSEVFIADEDNGGKLSFNIPIEKNKSLIDKKFVTIVPIGATLSTNDKIIAELKRTIGENVDVIYNHCSIVVRDVESQETRTEIEIEQKWKKLNFSNQTVETFFGNANLVHYDILIGYEDPAKNNWLRRLNSTVSLPDNFKEEQYVNPSENASINSQNLLGIPHLDQDVVSGRSYSYIEELKRLLDLKEDVYSGHIEFNGTHYRYYFDTESYIRRSPKLFDAWLDKVAKFPVFEKNEFNIIITPNARIESDLVNLVNEKVFGGNALILFFDVNNWKSNILNKFSYVSELVAMKKKDVHFHFVDHSLFSALTYKKTKSYLRTLCPDVSFVSGIVVINRLNFDLRQEIRRDFNDNLFVYFNLFAPETSDSSSCTQCDLASYYKRLMKSTALSSCRELIDESLKKIELKKLPDLKLAKTNAPEDPSLDRRFLRLFFAHVISYKVSTLGQVDGVESVLDPLYRELFDSKSTYKDEGLKLLNQKFKDAKFLYDKRISFLKALSSPPLSKYIILRKYAHHVLLTTLTYCLDKTEENCNYDDFRLMKAVLKSLSFFNSNAIIRKEVILRSYQLQIWNAKRITEELESYPHAFKELQNTKDPSVFDDRKAILEANKAKLDQFGKYYQFYIKNDLFEDGSKSCFLGELLRTGEEMREFPLSVSETLPDDNNSLLNQYTDYPLFKAFISDVFYDNTTITRKTLLDFEKEILRDHPENKLFDWYFERDANKSLHPFKDFVKRIPEIKVELIKKVHSGYYYSYFEPYLDNGDYIDFVGKFACLLFLKFKFEELKKANKRFRFPIEQEIQELLMGFEYIMEAKYSLYAVGDEDGIYHIDTEEARGELVSPDSYVCRLHRQLNTLPDIVLNSDFPFIKDDFEGAKHGVQFASSIIISVIDKEKSFGKNQTLSFFYSGLNSEYFLRSLYVRQRESAKLILLLREDLNAIFIDFLLKERVADLWIERNDSHIKFEKVYRSSAHVFNSVFDEMKMLENMEPNNLKPLNKVWFWLSNEIISFLYSNIEKYTDENGRHYLQLDSRGHILSEEDTIGDVFDSFFVSILKLMLEERWYKSIGNKITINGIDIDNEGWTIPKPKTLIHCKKQLFQTFIVQCLNNSFALESDNSHGHRGINVVKTVDIKVTENEIHIIDRAIKNDLSEENKMKRKVAFDFKAKHIREMSCHRYSSTTLTSVQGVTEYMVNRGCQFAFDFGFDEITLEFHIKLKFN